ncbi:MAG: glutamate synthase large subunit [Kiritimatiellaeota bacterium]|nr:glutamate synthase large subunit [Kiritimatiellota bacterium]
MKASPSAQRRAPNVGQPLDDRAADSCNAGHAPPPSDLARICRTGPHARPHGLYHPALERAACGVGLLCNLKGQPSHELVHNALQILVNLAHRGASGSDAKTGDGAGILLQLPDRFLRKAAADIRLPAPKTYAVGMVFLPRDPAQRATVIEWFETLVRREGQVMLGWRDVPVNNAVIGERKLLVIRKCLERQVRESALPERRYVHIPSLSSRTLVYKGLLQADQIEPFYPDLADPDLASGLALVHQRYSTNTFPTWDLAQPFRFLCHNGEINTLRGNINWMNARQMLFRSPLFGDDIAKLRPVLTPGASDSALLDNAVELLYHAGRSLPHAIMMLIPEAWQNHKTMSDAKQAFYEYHSCLMEPWDGPASIAFTDGEVVGAVLDRNGLRPSRYTVTKDGFVIMASETGVLPVDPANVLYKGRLQAGRMFLVDTKQGRIVDDEEIKAEICARQPYRAWLRENLVPLSSLPAVPPAVTPPELPLLTRQQLFGYTQEDLKIHLGPMAQKGLEPIGSMGTDIPLAVLSQQPQLLYNYFHQLFAQVTNPPLDAIREELVTSLITNLGAEQDLLQETPAHARRVRLEQPVLGAADFQKLRTLEQPGLRTTTLSILFDPAGGLEEALLALCAAAERALDDHYNLLILSDRAADSRHAPLPALLATAAVHRHLIRCGRRTQCSLIVDSGEPRAVHHFAVLLGYGASAIHPYLAIETVDDLFWRNLVADVDAQAAQNNYLRAACKGLLKVMSKMGISTLQSYRNAQIFEAVGLSDTVIERYFTGTASRVGGLELPDIARAVRERHARALRRPVAGEVAALAAGGRHQWRRGGEYHLFNPLTIAKLQQAARLNDATAYAEYSALLRQDNERQCNLRGLLDFVAAAQPVPLDEVEPWTAIVKRFKTGAMSYGSISQEAHEALAMAMNRLGGKSNSGEGGEDPERFKPDPDGNWRRSAIKQVASGRFGVTSNYLINALELQIKMAQGAKPGEGGQLPGEKVLPWIAKTRHATPYVQLISPPPHHDIYSIEDLAQLIHDLKNANTGARISVKLVSEVGVGTIAAGVAKGKADVVLISGWDGGTGAAPETALKHSGLPWELGLAETHQTLVLNDLRSRIVVEVDGKLMTGRDVATAILLGAEEFGFSTAPLVTLGCVMMRVCHLNTCPVGIATQDPELRKKFTGQPDHVINFFRFVAEELRGLMARLGFRTVDEMVGHTERLRLRTDLPPAAFHGLDLTRLLTRPEVPATVGTHHTQNQDHGLAGALDHELIARTKPAFEYGQPVALDLPIRNVHRTVGTMLSAEISRRYGEVGLPDDTIQVRCMGSAGQSFCAFGARGLTFTVEGDANDYFGKGLSGAKLAIFPPRTATFRAEENVVIGNVALYGATSGEAYICGLAGERFAVRNSGVRAVVEGVGDHGCEYMTGGRVVVLGRTGRNFAAGMSGGIAYVLDETGDFKTLRCNTEMVGFEELVQPDEVAEVRGLIERHVQYTGSALGRRVLEQWETLRRQFVKVMPTDYKRALQLLASKPPEPARRPAAAEGLDYG